MTVRYVIEREFRIKANINKMEGNEDFVSVHWDRVNHNVEDDDKAFEAKECVVDVPLDFSDFEYPDDIEVEIDSDQSD